MSPSQITIKKIREYKGHSAAIYRLLPGYSDTTFISAGGDRLVAVWNIGEDDGNALAHTTASIFCACKIPATLQIAVGQLSGALQVFDTHTHTLTADISQSAYMLFDIAVNANYLFAASGDGNVYIFDIQTYSLLHVVRLSAMSIRCLHLVDEALYAGASDNYLYKIALDDFSFKKLGTGHTNSIFSLEYLPEYAQIISGSRDAQLGVLDLEFNEQRYIPAHLHTINHIAYCPGNGLVATASRDKSIRLWDADGFNLLKVLDSKYDGHINSVNNVFWTADGKYLISCGDDRRIIQWQILIDNT